MYFSKLGTTEYNDITIPDILKRIVISNVVKDSNLFETYEIVENETPEIVSFNYYGSVNYYWTILLANNIKSRYFDWALGSQDLNQHIISKHGNKSAVFFLESKMNSVFNFCDVKYIAKVGTIYIWNVVGCDRNLNKLETEKLTDKNLKTNDLLSLLNANGEILTTITVDRIVYENEQSIHHFVDVDMSDRNNLNHTVLLEQYING